MNLYIAFRQISSHQKLGSQLGHSASARRIGKFGTVHSFVEHDRQMRPLGVVDTVDATKFEEDQSGFFTVCIALHYREVTE